MIIFLKERLPPSLPPSLPHLFNRTGERRPASHRASTKSHRMTNESSSALSWCFCHGKTSESRRTAACRGGGGGGRGLEEGREGGVDE